MCHDNPGSLHFCLNISEYFSASPEITTPITGPARGFSCILGPLSKLWAIPPLIALKVLVEEEIKHLDLCF